MLVVSNQHFLGFNGESMNICFITVSPSALKALNFIEEELRGKLLNINLKLINAIDEMPDDELKQMVKFIETYDLVFVDLMGAPPQVQFAVSSASTRAKGHIVSYGASSKAYMRLGKFSMQKMSKKPKTPSMAMIKKMQQMAEYVGKVLPGKMRDMRNYSLMSKYYQWGGVDNYRNLLLLILKEYGGVKGLKVAEPFAPPLLGYYDMTSNTIYSDLSLYNKNRSIREERDAVIILFNAGVYPMDTRGAVKALTKRLENSFDVYTVAVNGDFCDYHLQLKNLTLQIKDRLVAFINCMPFRLGAGPMGGDVDQALLFLTELDVPYIHPYFLTRRTELDWLSDARGCSSGEALISLMLPELDGAIEMMPIAALSDNQYNTKAHTEVQLVPIKERLERFAQRVESLARLRKLANSEKRIAILCYNYPPGESNLFGGAFLDTFQSIEIILKQLKAVGYQTDSLDKAELMRIFTAGGMVNSGRYQTNHDNWIHYSKNGYKPDADVEQAWGKAPGEIMTDNAEFLIPGIVLGNVFVGLQPARDAIGGEANYHDKTLPPHHQYIAYYQWLRDEFSADALIHVGTHGTIEFLKGKEIGISGQCWPDKLMGHLPHIYLYYCGNPSEATIAKRRSHAQLISYMPPVFVESGLYGEMLDLSTDIENYQQALSIHPDAACDMLVIIKEKAKNLGLPTDIDDLEHSLLRYRETLIPNGLHIFGKGYDATEYQHYKNGLLSVQGDAVASIDTNQARDCFEIEGLLRALNGRYTKARPAGDIYRNPAVLPTGFNLYQFDPRLVPSSLALQRGKQICQDTLALYKSEKGGYPSRVAIVLWGLETARTQGETVGQILAYIGAECMPNTSIWQRKYRIIPLAELGRPRIDVTVNICGFFRDMFADLLESLTDLFAEIQLLDEAEDDNYLRRHWRSQKQGLLRQNYSQVEAEEYAAARIFGPREGEYATTLTDLIETEKWQTESELGTAFSSNLQYIYSRHAHGKSIEGLYRENLKDVNIVSQLRFSNEYEITDLDHYYEFFGGLAKSVEMAKNQKAQMYISDTTRAKSITETVGAAINRGLRTRVLNPLWQDGLLAHDYHGVQKIADRFENVLGLAATTGAVSQQLFDDLEQCYVADEVLSRKMEENNPYAYNDILNRLMEYYQRGYWQADEEQLERIKQTHFRVETNLENIL